MTIILCDDNELFLSMISDMIKKYINLNDYEVISFSCGSELMEYCKHNAFDIVYMDIEVGKNNGIDMAKILKEINPKSLIIYMSGFDTYYVPLANAEPFRFIYKDGMSNEKLEKELINTMEAAIRRIKGRDEWFYSYGRMNYSILRTNIMYFYSFGRKIYIVADCKIPQEYYYGKLDEVEEKLKDIDERFIRINNRMIINMLHAYYNKTGKKIEINQKILSVSPLYRDAFHTRFKKYAKIKIV